MGRESVGLGVRIQEGKAMSKTPTHIYEVMFEDVILDKIERVSVHLTEEGARRMQDLAREKMYHDSSYYPDARDDFEEDHTFYVITTPILP